MKLASSEKIESHVARTGMLTAAGSVVLTAIWVVTMAVLSSSGDTAAQLAAHPVLFEVDFAACTLLTLLQVPLLVALGATAWARRPVAALVGAGIYLTYVPLNISCYFLNGAVLPRLIHGGPEYAQLAAAVDINSPVSLFGALDVLGYGLLGVGWIVLATALMGRSRLWNVTAALMIMGGAACVMGVVGLFVRSALLQQGVMVGGIVALAVYALLIPAFRSGR